MAILARLSIQGLRNLGHVELSPSTGCNLLFGENGAGKTSLLEAIYMLGHGKTFRGQQTRPAISEGLDRVTLFGQTDQGISLGIERKLHGSPIIHINGVAADSLADLSYSIPILLFNSNTLLILEGGPLERRKFLDWGVFHVEHQFLPAWRRARRALKHRNALLRSNAGRHELDAWSGSLSSASEAIHRYRSSYAHELQSEFLLLLNNHMQLPQSLGGIEQLSVRYRRGWQDGDDLAAQLEENLDKDRKNGYTSVGPHRADILFEIKGKDLATVLSRGQLKFITCMLKIAQARVLQRLVNKQSILLVDDLPAELDQDNRKKLCRMLVDRGLSSQTFVTAIEREPLCSELLEVLGENDQKFRLFHVKHGTIMPAAAERD